MVCQSAKCLCGVTGAVPVSGTCASSSLRSAQRVLFTLGGPFGFCAFALLSDCGHSQPRARLSGNRFEVYSSSSAFLVFDWRDFMTEGGMCQGNNTKTVHEYFDRLSTSKTYHECSNGRLAHLHSSIRGPHSWTVSPLHQPFNLRKQALFQTTF